MFVFIIKGPEQESCKQTAQRKGLNVIKGSYTIEGEGAFLVGFIPVKKLQNSSKR
jgi:hypothetical protein